MNDMESRKFEDAFKRAFEEASVSPSDNVWANIERTMDDMESRKFGGAFQQAFDEAGVRPSENVWTNIELDLMKVEGGKMKRRLVFFQLLAAASIAFALGVAGVGYYMLKDQELTGAAGRLAYQERNANANTTTVTRAGESPQAVPPGTTSTLGTGGQQTEQGATGMAPVAAGQDANAANQEQTYSNAVQAVSSPAESAGGVATTMRPRNAAGASNVAGATQTRTATVETAGATATQAPTIQPNGTETQQARAHQDAQRRRATDARNTDSSTDLNSIANRGRTDGNESTLVATNDANTTLPTAQQQALAGVTTQSGTTKIPGGATQNRTGIAGAAATSESDQQLLVVTHSSGRIDGQDSQRNNNASGNNGVTADAITTTPGATTLAAGQTDYMLAYSPVPSEATPVVTSLGARVQKPAGMKVEPASTVDPLVALLARLDEQEKNADAKDKKDKRDDDQFASEKLWTSVGFAAGSFNTINSSVSNSSGSMMMADARKDAVDKVASQQAKASGSSYSVGVSLGTRISSRWVLQGGVNYMTQASDYTASSVGTADFENFQAPSVNSIMSADKQSSSTEALSNVVPTAPYNVNNSLQFVSVPLQAGYLLVNRKVGVQLNGGLSTDLFIQNTITPDGDNLEKETKGNGSASPYRTVNFSGLVGTELSYRFSQHYRLALNPGVRYPLNSIYKSDQPVTATPLTFDIGLRFRYIFH